MKKLLLAIIALVAICNIQLINAVKNYDRFRYYFVDQERLQNFVANIIMPPEFSNSVQGQITRNGTTLFYIQWNIDHLTVSAGNTILNRLDARRIEESNALPFDFAFFDSNG